MISIYPFAIHAADEPKRHLLPVCEVIALDNRPEFDLRYRVFSPTERQRLSQLSRLALDRYAQGKRDHPDPPDSDPTQTFLVALHEMNQTGILGIFQARAIAFVARYPTIDLDGHTVQVDHGCCPDQLVSLRAALLTINAELAQLLDFELDFENLLQLIPKNSLLEYIRLLVFWDVLENLETDMRERTGRFFPDGEQFWVFPNEVKLAFGLDPRADPSRTWQDRELMFRFNSGKEALTIYLRMFNLFSSRGDFIFPFENLDEFFLAMESDGGARTYYQDLLEQFQDRIDVREFLWLVMVHPSKRYGAFGLHSGDVDDFLAAKDFKADHNIPDQYFDLAMNTVRTDKVLRSYLSHLQHTYDVVQQQAQRFGYRIDDDNWHQDERLFEAVKEVIIDEVKDSVETLAGYRETANQVLDYYLVYLGYKLDQRQALPWANFSISRDPVSMPLVGED